MRTQRTLTCRLWGCSMKKLRDNAAEVDAHRLKMFKSIAKGNKDADLKVISLGMGIQSTAVYLMSSMGILPRADYAIFADPQAEHYKTYQMLDWLLEWKDKNNGIEIIVNRDYNLLEDVLNNVNARGKNWVTIPAFGDRDGFNMRQCTSDYKVKPVNQTIRKLHELAPRKRMKPTELWLGISLDEIERVKESREYNITFFYPLLYKGMSRNDCVDFFKENNFPVPVKSACVFCPFHSNKFWSGIQKENGDAWEKSIKVDRAIRKATHPRTGEREVFYLHPSKRPLEEIDFDDGQESLFEGYDCEGYCGL